MAVDVEASGINGSCSLLGSPYSPFPATILTAINQIATKDAQPKKKTETENKKFYKCRTALEMLRQGRTQPPMSFQQVLRHCSPCSSCSFWQMFANFLPETPFARFEFRLRGSFGFIIVLRRAAIRILPSRCSALHPFFAHIMRVNNAGIHLWAGHGYMCPYCVVSSPAAAANQRRFN